jgi:hypothetical protein
VDCRHIGHLPNVAFSIGGRAFELTPEQVLLSNRVLVLCLSFFLFCCFPEYSPEFQLLLEYTSLLLKKIRDAYFVCQKK